MEKAVSMGKTSAAGSFRLFIGRIVSTLALGIGTIIVGMFISESDYGLYTIALVPAATLILFQDWGIGTALTKYCANYRASKNEGELRSFIISGLLFSILTGIILTLVSLVISNFVAVNIYGKPESGFLISVVSITIVFTAIYTCSMSIVIGFERMGISSVTSIIAATVQGLLSPLLVYFGYGAFGAVAGYTIASIASGIAGIALLYCVIYNKLPKGKIYRHEIFQSLKTLLRYGIPASIAAILSGILHQLTYFIMASYTALAMIGNFNIATNFAVFLTFFITPLQTVLFPAFSKLDALKDRQLLKTIYASSVKYSSIFLVPVTMAIMVLSTPMVSTIYADKWLSAPLFLTLYVSGNLVILLGNLSYGRLLYAMGETKILMELSALALVIGVPIAFLLIPPFGIIGVLVSGLISSFVSLIVGLFWTWKHYETKPDLQNSARILIASVIASLVTFVFLNIFNAAAWIMLSCGILLFLFIYLVSLPIVGGLNLVDITNLRLMFSEMRLVSKVFEVLLKVVEIPLYIKKKIRHD